jgi:hypothetical protein
LENLHGRHKAMLALLLLDMVYSVLSLLFPACYSPEKKSPPAKRCPIRGTPLNCLQATLDMSQPYKGLTTKLSPASMPVSWPLDGLIFLSTPGPSASAFLVSANLTSRRQGERCALVKVHAAILHQGRHRNLDHANEKRGHR